MFAGALGLAMAAMAQGQGVIVGTVGQGGGVFAATTKRPVSMELERTSVQTLADGTRITNTTRERFTRDSMGRTRTEFEYQNEPGRPGQMRTSVSVYDPVAGASYSWQTGPFDQKRYMVNKLMVNQPGVPIPAQPIQATALPPGMRPAYTREKLGVQDVQGVSCDAMRTTTIYPVGYMGNDRPLRSVHESCMSREFGRSLSDHGEDPRSGVSDTKLLSISRTEPEVSTYQPPAAYTPQTITDAVQEHGTSEASAVVPGAR